MVRKVGKQTAAGCDMERGLAAVDAAKDRLLLRLAEEDDVPLPCYGDPDGAGAQGGGLVLQPAQGPVEGQGPGVLLPPGVAAPVEGVLAALHARLVAVVDAGAAREGVLEEGRGVEPLQGQLPLLRRQPDLGLGLPVPGEVADEGGQNARGVVGAQGVHQGLEDLGRIVLGNGHDRLAQSCAVVGLPQEVEDGRAPGVVHHTVQLAVGEVAAADVVGGLVGGVLPDLA